MLLLFLHWAAALTAQDLSSCLTPSPVMKQHHDVPFLPQALARGSSTAPVVAEETRKSNSVMCVFLFLKKSPMPLKQGRQESLRWRAASNYKFVPVFPD